MRKLARWKVVWEPLLEITLWNDTHNALDLYSTAIVAKSEHLEQFKEINTPAQVLMALCIIKHTAQRVIQPKRMKDHNRLKLEL